MFTVNSIENTKIKKKRQGVVHLNKTLVMEPMEWYLHYAEANQVDWMLQVT